MPERKQEPVPITGDRLLNVRQASELTGLSVGTLNKARISGTVDAPPFVKLGKSVRYKATTVQRWIEDHQEYRHTSQQQAA